jgi:circadian clock protein KaiC
MSRTSGRASGSSSPIYYGFEETRPILLRNFRSMAMPMEGLIEKGNLQVMCRYPEATSPEDLLLEIRSGLDDFKPSLIVLDSISSIEHSTSQRGFRQFMIGFSSLMREHSRSALLTQATPQAGFEQQDPPYLSTIPDAILVMGYSVKNHRLQRTLQVLKMRGSKHSTEQHALDIGPTGLSVDRLGV